MREDVRQRIQQLEELAEERRKFILNGVEMGYVRLPDNHTMDAATGVYKRCLNKTEALLCMKCKGTGLMDSGGTQPWGDTIYVTCDCQFEEGGSNHDNH